MPGPFAILQSQPRLSLGVFPTPLQAAPRLGAAWGLPKLWVKRDDLTGLALGGNKVRKLEFELARAVSAGSTRVITTGGAQSNHARLTAAACARLGMGCSLLLCPPSPETPTGNLLLDHLLGAEIRWCDRDDEVALEAGMAAWASEYLAAGEKPYVLPLGGSTPVGALGYVDAIRELAEQLQEQTVEGAPQLVVGVGSCGTLAGMVVGLDLILPEATLFGVSVSRERLPIVERTRQLAEETLRLLGAGNVAVTPPQVTDSHRGIYGEPTPEGRQAMEDAARTEGLLLDPCYMAKVGAGLHALADGGRLDRDRPVVWWHTGGQPILFA